MYNLSREEQQLFRNVKDMFPDVSSDAIKRNLHKGLQELSEMILDRELPMGEEFRGDDEEKEVAKEDPPRKASKKTGVKREEKENEDGARPHKKLRKSDEEKKPRVRRLSDLIQFSPDEEDDHLTQRLNGVVGRAKQLAARGKALTPIMGGGSDEEEEPMLHRAPKKQQRAAMAAAAAEKDEEEDDYDPNFVMRPMRVGDKCNAHQKRPLVAWIECSKGVKQHLVCLDCLMIRHADGRLRKKNDDDEYTCPIQRCAGHIVSRQLHAVLRRHAPAFLTQLREHEAARQRRMRRERGMSGSEEEDEEGDATFTIVAAPGPSTPAGATRRYSQLMQATTPLFRRLSQESMPGTPRDPHAARVNPRGGGLQADQQVWTPSSRRAGLVDKDHPFYVEEDSQKEVRDVANDEELPVTEEEADDLRHLASFVDREKLNKLQVHFPETAVGWLVRHADYGLEALAEMVVSGRADPKMRERADGRGATSVIKTTLADRKQFECQVCYDDFDEHLAITCVYLARQRRRTLQPGEMEEEEPSAEERAKEEEEEERSRKDEHKFCADCIIGHARAALEQQVIMKGGVGIKCMHPNCKRALLRAHIEQVLDMQTRAVLDPLFSSEALLAANCDDVEKCQRCMFAAVMEDTKEQQPVFWCNNPACKHAHCRKCGRTWDKLHKNRTCEELDPEAMRKRVEEQLTEQSMHKCPRCQKGIVKIDGCNKIACPCGQLSCYVCKKAIKDYKHFKNGPAEEHMDKCPLWKDPTQEIEARRVQALNEQIKGAADDKVREELQRLQ